MGKRREQRKEVKLAVRIFGTDAQGRPFSENVSTVNISRQGALVSGVLAQVSLGEIVGLTYGKAKGRFRVTWLGKQGTAEQGRVGLQSFPPENCIWDMPLPQAGVDQYGRTEVSERRQHERMKCMVSAELRPDDQVAPIWCKVGDISVGGCYIEMPIPLAKGTRVKIGIWIQENKLWAEGKVVNSRPGFGFGVQFTKLSPEDAAKLKSFLATIPRVPR